MYRIAKICVLLMFLVGIMAVGWFNGHNPAGSDYASANSFVYSLKQMWNSYGVFSAWDDYRYGGHPTQMVFPMIMEDLFVGGASCFFSYALSVKLYFFLFFVLAGVTEHAFVYELTSNKVWSMVAAVFYVFVPYHFIEVIYEGHGGFGVAYAMIPLLFLYAYQLIVQKAVKSVAKLGIVCAVMVLSHPQTMLLLVGPWFIAYVFALLFMMFRGKRAIKQSVVWLLWSALFGVGISACWSLNAIWELGYYNTEYTATAAAGYDLSFAEMLFLQPISVCYKPSFNGMFLIKNLPYVGVILCSILFSYKIIRKKIFWKDFLPGVRFTYGCFCVFAVFGLYLTLGTRDPFGIYLFLYKYMPFFHSMRTPGRFLMISSFALAFIILPFLQFLFNWLVGFFQSKFTNSINPLFLWIGIGVYFVVVFSPEGKNAFLEQKLSTANAIALQYVQDMEEGKVWADLPLSTWNTENSAKRSTINPYNNAEILHKVTLTGTAPAAALKEPNFLEKWADEHSLTAEGVYFDRWMNTRGVDHVILHGSRKGIAGIHATNLVLNHEIGDIRIYTNINPQKAIFTTDAIVYYSKPEMFLQKFLNENLTAYSLVSDYKSILKKEKFQVILQSEKGDWFGISNAHNLIGYSYEGDNSFSTSSFVNSQFDIVPVEPKAIERELIHWGGQFDSVNIPFDGHNHAIFIAEQKNNKATTIASEGAYDVDFSLVHFRPKGNLYLINRTLNLFADDNWYYDEVGYGGDKEKLAEGKIVFDGNSVNTGEEVVHRRLFSNVSLKEYPIVFLQLLANQPDFKGIFLEARVQDEHGNMMKLDMTGQDNLFSTNGQIFLKKNILYELEKRYGQQNYFLKEIIIHFKAPAINAESTTVTITPQKFLLKNKDSLSDIFDFFVAKEGRQYGYSLLNKEDMLDKDIYAHWIENYGENHWGWLVKENYISSRQGSSAEIFCDNNLMQQKKVTINPGIHQFSVKGEQVQFLRVQVQQKLQLPKTFSASVYKAAPYKYFCKVNKDSKWFVFNQSFHAGWHLYEIDAQTFARVKGETAQYQLTDIIAGNKVTGKEQKYHISANGGLNAWGLDDSAVNDDGEYRYFMVEYQPQFRFEVTLLLTIASCIGAVIFLWVHGRRLGDKV